MWLNETEVGIWQSKEYSNTLKSPPIITYDDNKVAEEMGQSNINDVNGMILTSLFMIVNYIKYIMMISL